MARACSSWKYVKEALCLQHRPHLAADGANHKADPSNDQQQPIDTPPPQCACALQTPRATRSVSYGTCQGVSLLAHTLDCNLCAAIQQRSRMCAACAPRGTMRTDSTPAFSRSARLMRSGVGPELFPCTPAGQQQRTPRCRVANNAKQIQLSTQKRNWLQLLRSHLLQCHGGAGSLAAQCQLPLSRWRRLPAGPRRGGWRGCRAGPSPPAVCFTDSEEHHTLVGLIT